MERYKAKYKHCEEQEIKELLMFRKVVATKNENTLILDNGVSLKVIPNAGCSVCESGNYWIKSISAVPNAIMDVRFEKGREHEYDTKTVYRVYVICDGIMGERELFSVEGTDGNGYYGTGYEVAVIVER